MIDGLSNSDVVLGATGAAVVAILGSMIPISRRIADALIGFVEARRADSASLSVLSSAFAAAMSRTPYNRNVVLLVEDERMDSYQLQEVLCEVLRAEQYTLVITPTLNEAYRHQLDARVVIVDVNLPDSTELGVVKFVKEFGPTVPVIVWSGTEYAADMFPCAYAVMNKADKMERVVSVVRKALAEPARRA